MAASVLKKSGLFIVSTYLLLLALSWWVQWQFPVQEQINKYERIESIVWDGKINSIHTLQIGKSTDNPVLLIIPDAYNPDTDLIPFAESLSDSYSVLIPRLGKGILDMNHKIEDRAQIIRQLIQNLNSGSVHVAGFRYGGLIAIETTAKFPELIKSLTLIQSMGVEEIHFLGNYRINRSIYSLLIPVISIYEYAYPHFGRYYNQRLNNDYVSTMLAMDQRNIEDRLREIEPPALILHGVAEAQVPIQTAAEIHRLIPQSEFVKLDLNPELIDSRPGVWSEQLADFLIQTERGESLTRSEADGVRIAEAKEPFDKNDINRLTGNALITIFIMLILVSLISEDLACIAAGLLLATGMISFTDALFGSVAGIISADLLLYALGRWIGNPILRLAPFRWFIKESDVEWAKEMFDMRGAEILIAARFIPTTRLPVYLGAGILKSSFWPFLGYFLASLAVWAPILVGVTSLIGQPMLTYIDLYQEYAVLLLILALLLIYAFINYVMPLGTVKGRRRFIVKWNRFRKKYGI